MTAPAKAIPLRRVEARVSGAPNVMAKDVVYFHNEVHGPLSGEVTSVGRDGCRIHHPDHGDFQVLWEHVLGHKTRAQRDLVLLEQGEDGHIGLDADGKRIYIRGELGVPDPEGGQGELRKSLSAVGGSDLRPLAAAIDSLASAWGEHLRLQAQREEGADIRREALDTEMMKAQTALVAGFVNVVQQQAAQHAEDRRLLAAQLDKLAALLTTK